MVYMQEKLETFTSNVIREAMETRDTLVAEVRDEIVRRTEGVKLEIYARYNEKLQSEMARISKENNEKVSREILESKKQVLKMREEIVGKVFDEVITEVSHFMEQDAYVNFLAGMIEKGLAELGEGSHEAYLLLRDMKHQDSLKAKFSEVSFKESHQNILGGVILLNTDRQTIYDGSVQKMIETCRKDFIKEVGAIY